MPDIFDTLTAPKQASSSSPTDNSGDIFDKLQSSQPAPAKQFDLGASVTSAGNNAKDFGLGLPSGLAATTDLALSIPRAGMDLADKAGKATADLILSPFGAKGQAAPVPQLPRFAPAYDQSVHDFVQNPDAFRLGRSIVPSVAGSALVPGAGLGALAAGGAVGNVVTDAADQLADTGKFNPQALAGSAVIGAVAGPATHLGLKAAGSLLKKVGGKFIPKANLNAPSGQPAIYPDTTGGITPTRMNVIDPAHLEGDDLAAHQLLQTPVNPHADIFDHLEERMKGTNATGSFGDLAKQIQASAATTSKPRVKMSVEHALAGQPPTPPVIPPAHEPLGIHIGDFRHETSRYGGDRINNPEARDLDQIASILQGHPNVDVNHLRETITNLAKLFARQKYDESTLQEYAQRLFRQYRGEGDVVKHNGVTITNKPQEIIPHGVQSVIDKVRDSFASGVEKRASRSVRGLAAHNFGTNPNEYRMFSEEMPADKDEAFKRLVQLKDVFKGSVDRGNAGSGSRDAYEQAKKNAEATIKAAEAALKERTQNPFARLFVKTQVDHPLGKQHGVIEAGIEYANETLARKLEKNEADRFAQWQKVFKSAAIKNPKFTPHVNINASKAALAFGAGLLTLDQPSHAEGGGEEHEDHTAANLGLGLIALAAFHRFGPAAVEAFLKDEKLWRASSFFKDTLDHMDYLDAALRKQGKGIVSEIQNHQAAAIESQFGVKFANQNDKALAYSMLKNKQISPVDALSGAPGTVFEKMTPAERKAVVEFHLNRSTLASKVRLYKQEVSTAIDAGVLKKDNGLVHEATDALDYLHKALAPQAVPHSFVDRSIQGALSNAMDYFFFLNPKFHLLNLSDMFISGASRVGARNIFKANLLLSADKDIAQAFQHSNLTGSFRAERDAQAVAAGAHKKFEIPDIPSDKINADRVSLAAMLDYFDKNPQKMEALGYKAQAKFVKDMLSGKVAEPTLAADAWSHVAEVGSRTLGIDPFRINTDLVSRSASSPAFGVFVKQPARIARLAAHNIANRNLTGLYTMLTMTALLGGRAAIPIEVRNIWSSIDPDSSFEAQKALDKMNIVRNLTGEDTASKLDYSVFYPAQAATNPGVEIAHQLPASVNELYHAAHVLKDAESWQDVIGDEKMMAAAERLLGSIATIAKPRILGLPVRQGLSILKSGQSIAKGHVDVSYYDASTGRIQHKKDELDMDTYNVTPFDVVKDQFLPGTPAYSSALKQASAQESFNKLLGKPRQSIRGYMRDGVLQNMQDRKDVLVD